MNYIIKGGEFNNKGAEAMSLIAIYHILEHDQNANIYFFDYGYDMGIASNLSIVPFRVQPDYLAYLSGKSSKRYLLNRCKNFIKFFLKPRSYIKKREYIIAKDIISSADFFIDISGFSLSSVWGSYEIDFYLTWLEAVKKNSPQCKIILMPQSYGPFDDLFDKERAFKILSQCEKIYAREKKGYVLLNNMGLNNVEFCFDSVLIENKYRPELVLRDFEKYSKLVPRVEPESVAIVPNARLVDIGKNDTVSLLVMYAKIIDAVSSIHNVYLIPHAGEDLELCKRIKSIFLEKEKVILIDTILNSFNFEKIVKNMSFIIASRYHSIIHAYKESIPAVILGWSEKYNEVAKAFNQERYIIDVNNIKEVINTVKTIETEYKNESRIIGKKLIEIQSKYDCYSFLT